MEFKEFSKAMVEKFETMSNKKLYRVKIDKDTIWDTYINSFPAGSNPIFEERTEHDCNCCKTFIRNAGKIVTVENNIVCSIWDVDVSDDVYKVVAKTMSELIKRMPIESIYLNECKNVGKSETFDEKRDITWNHFHLSLPDSVVVKDSIKRNSDFSNFNSTRKVFKRSLQELTVESL